MTRVRPRTDKPGEGQPGHDGNPPETVNLRDPAGAGKRALQVTLRADRLEWLRQRGLIADYQFQAGRKLQHDWEVGLIADFRSLSPDKPAGGRPGPPEFGAMQIDARRRFADAMRAAGGQGSKLLEQVVLRDRTLEEVARLWRWHPRAMTPALWIALDVLARHYRMA